MKKEEFKKLVRPIIKEELYKVLSDVLPSLLAEVVSKEIVSNQQPRPQTTSTQPRQPQKPVMKISNNPLLNEVFNQTKGGISDGSELVGLDGGMPTIGEMMQNPMDHMMESSDVSFGESDVFSVGDHGQYVELEQLEEIAPAVAKALTKDYSQLMKAVDSKRVQSQPSNIDFTNYHG